MGRPEPSEALALPGEDLIAANKRRSIRRHDSAVRSKRRIDDRAIGQAFVVNCREVSADQVHDCESIIKRGWLCHRCSSVRTVAYPGTIADTEGTAFVRWFREAAEQADEADCRPGRRGIGVESRHQLGGRLAAYRRAVRRIGGSMKRSVWLGIAVAALSLLADGCAKSRETAEAATRTFRRRAASGEFASIYKDAAPEFQKATTEVDFAKLMEGIGRKVGAWQSSKPPGWKVFSGMGGRTVTLGYASQFEKGAGNEEFIWRIEGESAILVGYHINSPLLLADDLLGTRPPNKPLQQSGSPP